MTGWQAIAAEYEEIVGVARSRARRLQTELAECRADAEDLSEQSDSLRQRETELRAKLSSEIAARDVEIEVLRGKLTVRVLDRVLFDTGSAQIRSEGVVVLTKLAEALSEGREPVRIEGHTDDVPIGTGLIEKYPTNWELGGARAASVARFLQSNGVAPQRLEAVSRAFYVPVAPNDSPANRQRNRRVEIVISG